MTTPAKSFIVIGKDGSLCYLRRDLLPEWVLDFVVYDLPYETRFASRDDAEAAIDSTIKWRARRGKTDLPVEGRAWWSVIESDKMPTDDAEERRRK